MQRSNPCFFTPSFINDQRELLIAASRQQGALNRALYNKIEWGTVLDEMAKIAPGDAEAAEDTQLNNVANLILATTTALKRKSGNLPTAKALESIYQNVVALASYHGFTIKTQQMDVKQVPRVAP